MATIFSSMSRREQGCHHVHKTLKNINLTKLSYWLVAPGWRKIIAQFVNSTDKSFIQLTTSVEASSFSSTSPSSTWALVSGSVSPFAALDSSELFCNKNYFWIIKQFFFFQICIFFWKFIISLKYWELYLSSSSHSKRARCVITW